MVKLRFVLPFSGMLAAPNALVSDGGATTVMLALEVLPVPPLVALTVTLLIFTPAVVPVTFTDTVQLPLPAIVPAERLTALDPAAAVAVPPHVLLKFGVAATTKPAGRLSVKATPVLGLVLGLLMANDKVVVPFSGTDAAPNDFVMLGGEATLRLALAVLPVPPLVELTLPVVLVYEPEVAPVTVTLN